VSEKEGSRAQKEGARDRQAPGERGGIGRGQKKENLSGNFPGFKLPICAPLIQAG